MFDDVWMFDDHDNICFGWPVFVPSNPSTCCIPVVTIVVAMHIPDVTMRDVWSSKPLISKAIVCDATCF